jgi:GNAT superfamily N-acetyltransferase
MPPAFDLRGARPSDFAFCWPIYRDAMQPLTEALMEWHEPSQRRVVELALADAGASILRSGGAESGWLHVQETPHVIQLRQLFVLPAARNRGLGTSFLTWMKERADRKRKDLNAELMSNSPARKLLERLGFKAVNTSGQTLTMRY